MVPEQFTMSNKKKVKRLMRWMKQGGTLVDKMELKLISKGNRGVFATTQIYKGEELLYVPMN